MKFLFFDIECADCYKKGRGVICEFGYVLTDDRLNVTGRDTLLVAPEVKFNPYVIKNLLAFTEKKYNTAPTFRERHDEIRALLADKDTVVIGHTTSTDAGYLNYATKRYKLPPIDFEFFDIKKIHKHQTNAKEFASLENMLKEFNLDFDGRLHKSEDDAYLTMLAFKALCQMAHIDAKLFLLKYAQFKEKTRNGKVKEVKLPSEEGNQNKKRRATGS
ncbi:MAG: hypothetical protein K2J01_02610 [Clostridiales bacterium]|nr:hypothetical protein [Clostridiales bacterium]